VTHVITNEMFITRPRSCKDASDFAVAKKGFGPQGFGVVAAAVRQRIA
jgi:hypothetical protein